jgi:hypothetical protein
MSHLSNGFGFFEASTYPSKIIQINSNCFTSMNKHTDISFQSRISACFAGSRSQVQTTLIVGSLECRRNSYLKLDMVVVIEGERRIP